MTNKLWQDAQGNTSSKRVSGLVGVVVWLVLSAFIILRSEDITNNKVNVLNNIGIVSGAILGVGAFEKLRKNDK